MLPTLLLVGIGSRRRFWLPLPTVLLWPFWLLGWVPWALLRITGTPWAARWRMAMMLGWSLSGLRVDVDAADGTRVHIKLV